MSNDDKILENDIQYMLRGCDPHDAEARRHIARCIIAYVREHDGRDAERPCTCHPDDNPPRPCPKQYALHECKAAIDAAIARGKK